MTQIHLGGTYMQRIRGERTENLEKAIHCFKTAAESYTKEDFPQEWATTQIHLGDAYMQRIKGEWAENLEQAIRCYEAGLEVYTQEKFPEQWAAVQNLLGLAYSIRPIEREKAENLERAICCYEAAQEVYTQEAFPERWAGVQSNLGNAYIERIKEEKAQNMEEAIRCFKASQEVYTREAFPQLWATVQHGLGLAYKDRIKGERAENLEQAIECFRNSIVMSRFLMLWNEVRVSCWDLGDLYKDEGEWEAAYTAYREAIAAMEQVRMNALTESERTRLIREHIDTFERLVVCCMHIGRVSEGVEFAEQCKARNLSDLLSQRERYPRDVPEVLRREYEALSLKVRGLEHQMHNSSSQMRGEPLTADLVAAIRTELLQTHQSLTSVVAQIRALHPDFRLDAEPMIFSDIQQLARDANSTIVQINVTQEETFAFLITGVEGKLHEEDVIRSPDLTSTVLGELIIDGWLEPYYTGNAWRDCVEQTLEALYDRLFAPIHQRLKALNIERIAFISNRGLDILPLHAMSYHEDGEKRYLIDDFEIAYAPSCQILRRCLERDREGRERDRFVGVANPTDDPKIRSSEWEVDVIQQKLVACYSNAEAKSKSVLSGKKASKSAVLKAMASANLHHFACHGSYQFENPLESHLLLADGELTLGEIFVSYDAGQAWSVVLSACETGLTENWLDSAGESVGLPAGFLYAGAPNVIASLWIVDDFSTTLLMTRLYENILQRGMGRAAGLREAQHWLRGLSKEEAVQLLQAKEAELQTTGTVPAFERMSAKGVAEYRAYREALRKLRRVKEFYPFAHPYWWGAFQCVGAF